MVFHYLKLSGEFMRLTPWQVRQQTRLALRALALPRYEELSWAHFSKEKWKEKKFDRSEALLFIFIIFLNMERCRLGIRSTQHEAWPNFAWVVPSLLLGCFYSTSDLFVVSLGGLAQTWLINGDLLAIEAVMLSKIFRFVLKSRSVHAGWRPETSN